MNFSKFSQNKLDKEQMLAVKGGNPGWNDFYKCINGRRWHVVGNSCLGSNGWTWEDHGSGWVTGSCQSGDTVESVQAMVD